jgi:2-oxoglutarate dehydrogenase E2 component (dihydrolipoamide succinyltransferase)
MSVDVIMPQMGESIAEGTVTKWLKKIGDRVKRDEPLFEISTDKVDAEIPSPTAGVLAEIIVGEGKTVEVNTVVARIAAEGEAVAAPPAQKAELASGGPAVSKAPSGPAAPAAAPVESGNGGGVGGAGGAQRAGGIPSREDLRRTRSSPLVRKIAAQHAVDISAIAGTGISGRVTKRDILAYLEKAPATPAPARAANVPPVATLFKPGETIRVEPMSVMRKKIAEHMVTSKRTSAHVTTFFEVDMTGIARLREKYRAAFEGREGIKLTYLPFIAKAAIEGIRRFPVINSSVEGDSIVYKKDVNLGIAVALDWGLIVPVVKKADEKNILGLARAFSDVGERARAKKLSPDEVTGGTFTITNPGVFGGLIGTPIISQPQVAILGVGVIEKRPIVIDDAIAIRSMCYLALSFDHRIIDGADADRYMAYVKETLQRAAFTDLGI